MIRHFVVFPSGLLSRGLECAAKWAAKGYEVLIGVDSMEGTEGKPYFFTELEKPFAYYKRINGMVKKAFLAGADLVTCCGDDQDPPEQEDAADFIYSRYTHHFPNGYGVMQPCGDPQGDLMVVKGFEHLGPLHNAGRICGSPVFDLKWATSGYKGGAFCDEYASFYSDEDLWNRAHSLGVLWLDGETQHFHRHWSFRKGLPKQPYHSVAQANWAADKATFERRKAEGFPA